VNNDGLLEVLAVGPASEYPGWAPKAELVNGRYWKNLGGFRCEESTEPAGLGPLNWTIGKWAKFFVWPVRGKAESRPYFADAVSGDYNNDGWIDLVVQDRSERAGEPPRAMLFLNRGDGTFELKPTEFGGLSANGICGEAVDLNNDGLLDMIFPADPDNSGLPTGPLRKQGVLELRHCRRSYQPLVASALQWSDKR
jgi:hypothetical protein